MLLCVLIGRRPPRSTRTDTLLPYPTLSRSFAVPAEVKAAAGAMMMTQLYAYGPEADFSYPPRPKNAPASWAPDWTARVRYKSNTSLMLGMPGMGAMMGGSENDDAARTDDAPKQQKKK